MKKIAIVIFVLIGFWFSYILFVPFEVKFFLYPSTRTVLNKSKFYIDKTGWKSRILDKYMYGFGKEDGDTLKYLYLLRNYSAGTFTVHEYIKVFNSYNKTVRIILSDADTLCLYTISSDSQHNFIRGKYYYDLINGKFSSKQANFFKLHKDSLIRISGDSLDRLPEIN